MKKILSLLTAFIISACGTTTGINNEYQGPDAGVIVIGIGESPKSYYSSYSLYFRKIDESKDKTKEFIYIKDNLHQPNKCDYETTTENGIVKSLRLEPGEYEIYNFDIYFNNGRIQKNFSSKNNFSIPFKVNANETTYLGHYQANQITSKNIIGIPMPARAIFSVKNRENIDIRLLKKCHPSISLQPITNSTPNTENIANVIFFKGN